MPPATPSAATTDPDAPARPEGAAASAGVRDADPTRGDGGIAARGPVAGTPSVADAAPSAPKLQPANSSPFDPVPELGGAATASPAVAVPALGPGMPANLAGQLLLRQQLSAWRGLLPAVRAGEDAEALHQLRVTGRRMIAVLRVLEAAPVAGALGLRRRVQALVRGCGAARDLDVQLAEIAAAFDPGAAAQFAVLRERLERRRRQARARMLRLLDGPRATALLAALDRLAEAPPRSRRPRTIAVAARELIRRRYRRARRAARQLGSEPSLDNCHALRLEAKKLRYVAECFDALYGEPLGQYLRRLQRLQTLLGRVNDARHAIHTLETEAGRARRGLSPAALFAMGRAAERQQARLQDARERAGAQLGRLSGRRWRRLRERMDEVAARVTGSDAR